MPYIQTEVLFCEEELKHVVGSFLHIDDQCFKLDEVCGWVEDMKQVDLANIKQHVAENARRARRLRIKLEVTPAVEQLIQKLEGR